MSYMSSLPRLPVRFVLTAAAAALLTSLTSCSSSGAPAATGSAAPSASPAGSPPAATASPTPSLPEAADGTKTRACRDGRCEIRLSGRSTVPLPEKSGLGDIEVISVKNQTLTMVVPLNQGRFSSEGGCNAAITGGTPVSVGYATLSCRAGEGTTINAMRLEVLGIVGKSAVIRIQPSP